MGLLSFFKKKSEDEHFEPPAHDFDTVAKSDPFIGKSSFDNSKFEPDEDHGAKMQARFSPQNRYSGGPDIDLSLGAGSSSQPQSRENNYVPMIEKDIALISSKLDTIKSQLESLSNRMAHLEKIAESETEKKPVRW